MSHIETFHHKKIVAAETLVSDSKQTSSIQYRWSQMFAVKESIETFRHKKMVAAENVGFRFEVDFFKSVPMILGFGGHGQHWDVSQ